MKKILLTLIAVMIGAMNMHAQDDVYGKQQQLNEQKAQVELKQKLNRQEQKRLQQQIDSIQHEQALQAMRDSMFTLEANRVVFKYGQRAYVTPSTNFVAVKKNKATVQLSFNIPVAGPNGMGGVTVEGTIGKYKMETDKSGSVPSPASTSAQCPQAAVLTSRLTILTTAPRKCTATSLPQSASRTQKLLLLPPALSAARQH